jgi:hypothetical protein
MVQLRPIYGASDEYNLFLPDYAAGCPLSGRGSSALKTEVGHSCPVIQLQARMPFLSQNQGLIEQLAGRFVWQPFDARSQPAEVRPGPQKCGRLRLLDRDGQKCCDVTGRGEIELSDDSADVTIPRCEECGPAVISPGE